MELRVHSEKLCLVLRLENRIDIQQYNKTKQGFCHQQLLFGVDSIKKYIKYNGFISMYFKLLSVYFPSIYACL